MCSSTVFRISDENLKKDTMISINDIPWVQLLKQNHYHASPRDWSDQVIYFLLIDRFSDGNEDGYKDVAGQIIHGTTQRFSPGDAGNAVQTQADIQNWQSAGAQWLGGTLKGIQSKIGYLKRLGVTSLWISPVLRQRPGVDDYHGYGTQNFLEVDPHFGTAQDFKDLVDAAHAAGLNVILDVILNHSADVFQYDTVDPNTGRFYEPMWNGDTFPVAGWRDGSGVPSLPFPTPVNPADTDAAVWPKELQADGVFTRKGKIGNWDHVPETTEGDFEGLKDIHQGTGPVDDYTPSAAMQVLTEAYQYWIAYADVDGFRVDTVKHMDRGAMRYFASAIHEFSQTLGKDSFLLVGEITGSREDAVEIRDETGLDAALGLADVQGQMVDTVKGWTNPQNYFDLFRNSYQVDKASHTWFRNHVVTNFDDHDLVRMGRSYKARFASDQEGSALELAVLAMNATTLGIPCIYYGSEQRFDGKFPTAADPHPATDFKADRYIREAMFGGNFGSFRSRGRHFFDESAEVYMQLANILAIRRNDLALRRGRQYLRPISEDGISFWYPTRIGPGRMTSVVAWSRIIANREVVCAMNTDVVSRRAAWVTIDAGLHSIGDKFQCAYSTEQGQQGSEVAAEGRNGLAISIDVGPAGFVIMAP
ncbi:alpha-amylase family glycosyl hydrolase [Arthrobacter sp. ov118]|uniref:alpha-amylase family glycosyl hydrolase n=1 Tax=Arthrobacter sp. ov118 TaxID=1761747 RepID=UPI001C433D93|nr:alpha-amylase family glycosyl hydrolase [Arthrobacter sp. ov118]